MISRKILIAVAVGLVFLAGGASAVLESFGTVSGTADVERPLEIEEVNYDSVISSDESGEYILLKSNLDEVDLASWSLTVEDSENFITYSKTYSADYIALVDNSSVVENKPADTVILDIGDLGLANTGESITLSHLDEGAEIHTVSYSDGECDEQYALNVSDGCETPYLDISEGGSE